MKKCGKLVDNDVRLEKAPISMNLNTLEVTFKKAIKQSAYIVFDLRRLRSDGKNARTSKTEVYGIKKSQRADYYC